MRPLIQKRIRLIPGCRIHTGAEEILIETRESIIKVQTHCPDALATVLSRLYRPDIPLRVMGGMQISEDIVESVLQSLAEDDLVIDELRSVEALNSQESINALLAEARFQAKSIFEQPFWSELLTGNLSSSQVIGWGVEFFHFVEAANYYMPLGVAYARRHRITRGLLAKHYVEEMSHGEIFLEGLIRCGVDRRSVELAPPLPHTSALVNLLAELAIEGEVTYAASFAVMQPGLSLATQEAVDEFYEELCRLYPYAGPMFDAFRKHALIDVDLHHEETVFARLCQNSGGLSLDERSRAGWAMSAVAEAFTLFFEGILDSYKGSGRFAPRRPLIVNGL
jgi:pyrroloquinoline quinone (PQQ) biosynthesis protein C